jgi:hypothetical protein
MVKLCWECEMLQSVDNWHLFIGVVVAVFLMVLGAVIAHLLIYGGVLKWIIKTLILSCT